MGSSSPASGRPIAASRMAPDGRATTTLPSAARKPMTGAPPESNSSSVCTPRTLAASSGGIDRSSEPVSRPIAARIACRVRPRSAIIASGDIRRRRSAPSRPKGRR